MTLGEGGGNQHPPSHTRSGLLIADMFEEGLETHLVVHPLLGVGVLIKDMIKVPSNQP